MKDWQYYEDIKTFFAWFLPAFLGVATKLAYESSVKKITKARVLTSFVMACFVGYIFDSLCTKYGLSESRGIIVSIGALTSESIIQYVLAHAPKLISVIIKKLGSIEISDMTKNETNKKDKKDKNDNTLN